MTSKDGCELLQEACSGCNSCWQRYALQEQITAFAGNVAHVDEKVAALFNHGIREDFTTFNSDDESHSHLSPDTRTAIANAARNRHAWLARAALSLDADALVCSGGTDSTCPLPSSIRRYERLIPPYGLPYLPESDSAPVLKVEPSSSDSDNQSCS